MTDAVPLRSMAAGDADLSAGLELAVHLSTFVSRQSDESENRLAHARGLVFEVLHFGLRVGLASGRMFGGSLSDDEQRNWLIMGQKFGAQTDEMARILVTTRPG
jgi:hypothetical protein